MVMITPSPEILQKRTIIFEIYNFGEKNCYKNE